MKIPKVIHYCWFGKNELPQSAIDCINSWKKFCPDYEIKQWDETNFDINKYDFVKEAYEAKKWAFVSDVARLDIIYNNGGIYFDVDVQILKSFDDLLDLSFFMGYENDEYVATGLGFGAEPFNEFIYENLKKYEKISFKNVENISTIACPIITTNLLKEKGFNIDGKTFDFNNGRIFSKEYFCPMDYETGKKNITDKAYSIHLYDASWKDNENKKQDKFENKLYSYLVIVFGRKISKFISHKVARLVFFIKSIIMKVFR